MASATLRAVQANLSIINPSTNQYMQYGRMVVIAMRKDTKIAIVVLAANKKPVVAIQSSPAVNWVLQNMVYCSFVSGGHRGLLQFPNAQEAELFTAFALSGKLFDPLNNNASICITQAKGPAIPPDFPFKVNYKCYDLMSKKIDGPIMDEKDFEVSPADEQSPLKSIAKEGSTAGSVFLVAYPHNIVGIVHSISETSDLPSFGSTKTENKSVNEEGEVEQPSKKKKKYVDMEEEERAKQQELIQQQLQQKQQQQQAVNRPPPPGSVSPNSMYDSQLESIRNEMQSKFIELSQMIASLRRTLATQSSIPLMSDILISSIQRLLKENQYKDQQIAEKKQLLDILNARQSDTRERDALRIKLAELGTKLSAQRQKTREKNEEQEALSKKIMELQSELSSKKVNAEVSLNELRQQLNEDKKQQIDQLYKQRDELNANAKRVSDELQAVKAEFEKTLNENKRLKEMTSKDKTKELEELQKKAPAVINNAVKGMISGVFRMVQANFLEDNAYDGESIKKAIRLAMQRQANTMLTEMEQDADNVEEDEDQEDEDEQ